MSSPYLLIFLLSLTFGTFLGIYIGNRKIRHAISGLIRGSDDADYYDDED